VIDAVLDFSARATSTLTAGVDFMHAIRFVIVAFVAPSTFWTANDPFVGKWRLDVSRSTIVDEMRVEALSGSKYSFSFEGAPAEIVVADGTDQPGLPGTTLAVKTEDAHNLTVMRKQDGRIIVSAAWKLSQDGRTLRDAFTAIQPDGSTVTVDYLYRRLSGTTGFAGDWESTTKPVELKLELRIQPYMEEGLSFDSPSSEKNVNFDGKDHAVPGAKDDLTVSGRRRGARALEYTETSGGKVEHARKFQLSRDGRTLTETVQSADRSSPDVFVFERE
jgi:hypothetical protein